MECRLLPRWRCGLHSQSKTKNQEVPSKRLTQREEAFILGGIWQLDAVLPLKSTLKAAEVEFPLILCQGFCSSVMMKAK